MSKNKSTARLRGLAAIMAAGLALSACDQGVSDETCEDAAASGKADDANQGEQGEGQPELTGIAGEPTEALKFLRAVPESEQLAAIFEASNVERGETVARVFDILDQHEADVVTLKGRGVPVFTNDVTSALGMFFQNVIRTFWAGKFFTFKSDGAEALDVTLTNDIINDHRVKATVTVSTLAEAMSKRGEDPPGPELDATGPFRSDVAVDGKPSVILDYEGTEVGMLEDIIDEIRPVTPEALAAAGMEAPEGVDISNLWIGRATSIMGLFTRERKFVIYFALDFDLDNPVEVPQDDADEG